MRIHNAVIRLLDRNKLLAVPDDSLRDCRILTVPLYGARIWSNPGQHITGQMLSARLPLLCALRGVFLTIKRQSEDLDMASLINNNNNSLQILSYGCDRSKEAEDTTEAFHAASSVLHGLNTVKSTMVLGYLLLSQLDCHRPDKQFERTTRPFQLVSLFLDGCIMTNEHFDWILASQQAR
jgi:hypothetical protein